MNKVIVAGSRSITDEDWVREHLDRILENVERGEIVSGEASGPDSYGENWAVSNGWIIKPFPADWDNLGRRAGYQRNAEMAAYGTHLIAFYDGQSKGTQHMIRLARDAELKVRIVRTNKENTT